MPRHLIGNVQAVRRHVPAEAYTDDALVRIIDWNEAEIIRVAGPHDGERELIIETYPGQADFSIKRPAKTIAAIAEGLDEESVPVTAIRLLHGGYTIRRKSGAWVAPVKLTYTPVPDNPRRELALIQMIRLDVQDTGLKSYGDGVYREQSADIGERKTEILRELVGAWVV